jgi:hypothetical protein
MKKLQQNSMAGDHHETMQKSHHILPIVTLIVSIAVLISFGQGALWAKNEKARVVGTAKRGINAVEYIGVIEQDGPEFMAVGYLTYVRGLDPTDLFTNPLNPDASTARFTFSGDSSIVSRAQVGTVTQLGTVGTLTIYFNESGGANFDDPDSFSSGLEIASFDARFYNVLTVIAPNQGVSSGIVDTVQQTAHRFMLNGRRLQFGHPRLIQRMTMSGGATRSEVGPPVVSTNEFAAAAVTP